MQKDKDQTRINRDIRCREVLVIGADGEQLGVMPPKDALKIAEEEGYDLVEVAPNAQTPVCRIMDYGKYKYQQSKRANETRKKRTQSQITLKEVKLRPRTDEHDLQVKMRTARKFLAEKNKVKITMQFRGREMAHINIGQDMMTRIAGELASDGNIETSPRLEGRFITMIFAPKT